MSKLTLIYGTSFEIPTDDPTLDSPRVRAYRANGRAFIGDDTDEIGHVCGHACASAMLREGDPLVKCESGDAWINPETGATVDVVSFDRGEDPYVLCDACGEELYRDDAEYLAQYGRPLSG